MIASFLVMRFRETTGHWPLMKAKQTSLSSSSSADGVEATTKSHFEEAKGEKKFSPETAEKPVAPTEI